MLAPNPYKYGLSIIIFSSLIIANTSWGEDLNQLNNQELINQQQAITEQLNRTQPFNPTKIINAPAQQTLPLGEKPCFIIQQLDINTPNPADKKHFLTILDYLKYGSQSILGQCIGQQGLIYINNVVQNTLIEKGFLTSQSTISNQDISQKKLIINIIPGKFNQAWLSPDSAANTNLYNSLIPKKNQILKLADIETSVDNLRLPNGVEANLSILPSQPTENSDSGYSDLVVSYKKHQPISLQLNIDDSGNQATGKYKAGINLDIVNPLQSNDQLSLSYTHSIDDWNNTITKSGNDSYNIQYSYPFRKNRLKLNHNHYQYYQTLVGLNEDIIYQGISTQNNLDIERQIYRDSKQKTNLQVGLYQRSSDNYFDDIAIDVQRRKTAGWKIGLKHQRELKNAKLQMGFSYQKGTGMLGSIPAPESFVGEGSSQPAIWEGYATYQHPFNINNRQFNYSANLRTQYSPQLLTPQDRFSLGGRYSVRGFSDEQSIAGDSGILLQQEFNASLSYHNLILQPYLAFDQGRISGDSSRFMAGKYLLGSVVGIRLYDKNFSLDGFWGKGLIAPFATKGDSTTGFSLSVNY